jgi:hypothetical protein
MHGPMNVKWHGDVRSAFYRSTFTCQKLPTLTGGCTVEKEEPLFCKNENPALSLVITEKTAPHIKHL